MFFSTSVSCLATPLCSTLLWINPTWLSSLLVDISAVPSTVAGTDAMALTSVLSGSDTELLESSTWKLSCDDVSGLSHNWFKSMSIKFLAVRVIFRFLLSCLLHITSRSVSITALIPFKNLLEIKKGVGPSTTAIWNLWDPRGKSNAWRLTKVWWLPNRKIKRHGTRFTCLRTQSGNCDNSSGTCWLPMTVWEAPRSTTPMDPEDAKRLGQISLSTLDSALHCLRCRKPFNARFNFGSGQLALLKVDHFLETTDRLSRFFPKILPKIWWVVLTKQSVTSALGRQSSDTSSDCTLAGISDAVAKDVGTVDALEAPPLVPLFGHSFFQWPFFIHRRQYELAILVAREALLFPFPFPFLPPPFSPFFTLQKPRNLNFSDRRFRASWYDE